MCDALAHAEQHFWLFVYNFVEYLPNRLVDFHKYKLTKEVLEVNSNWIQPALSLLRSYKVVVGGLVQSSRTIS